MPWPGPPLSGGSSAEIWCAPSNNGSGRLRRSGDPPGAEPRAQPAPRAAGPCASPFPSGRPGPLRAVPGGARPRCGGHARKDPGPQSRPASGTRSRAGRAPAARHVSGRDLPSPPSPLRRPRGARRAAARRGRRHRARPRGRKPASARSSGVRSRPRGPKAVGCTPCRRDRPSPATALLSGSGRCGAGLRHRGARGPSRGRTPRRGRGACATPPRPG